MTSTLTENEPETDRFAELRATVAAIQQHNREHGRPADAVSGRTAPDWLERAVGLFEGSEAFEDAVRFGEAWRNAARPQEDE